MTETRRYDVGAVIGILLILAGLLFLLTNLNILPVNQGWLWAGLFALAGLAFLALFLRDVQANWGTIIPAFVFLGLAGMIALSSISQALAPLGGAIFLAAIGLSFLVIYLLGHERWWAIIPAGSLFSVALIAAIGEAAPAAAPGILFLGLGLTFGALYFAPTPFGRPVWAIFPAAALLIMGAVVSLLTTSYVNLVWPVILIVAGLFLLFRRLR